MISDLTPVIVAGPTGVGKSHFAVELALALNGEIIGADAFQIYAGMARLTAQPEANLRARVPHHLVGNIPLGDAFNAGRYLAEAERIVREIQQRGKRPILCGGTGLYLKAFTHGLAEMPRVDAAIRAELEAASEEELLAELNRRDPAACHVIDLKNRRRVVRAVEICRATGRPVTEIRKEWQQPKREFRAIVLQRDREELRERIRHNVAQMFENGVVEEVETLGEIGETASQAIGLSEIRSLLRGEISMARCQEGIVNATRQYAKRQLTWFRSQANYLPLQFTPEQPLATSLQSARRLLE